MVKKTQKKNDKESSPAALSGLMDLPFASNVKDSAQQIWLAGLGAFSKAQAEGGKVFEALVKDGVDLQRKTQSQAANKLAEVGEQVTGLASGVSAKAGRQWDKLESIFEDRTARALGRLGIPTARDLAALHKRLDALNAEVARLSRPASAVAKAATAGKGVKAAPKRGAATKAAPPAPRKKAARAAAKKKAA